MEGYIENESLNSDDNILVEAIRLEVEAMK